jgi:hypothetical protein
MATPFSHGLHEVELEHDTLISQITESNKNSQSMIINDHIEHTTSLNIIMCVIDIDCHLRVIEAHHPNLKDKINNVFECTSDLYKYVISPHEKNKCELEYQIINDIVNRLEYTMFFVTSIELLEYITDIHVILQQIHEKVILFDHCEQKTDNLEHTKNIEKLDNLIKSNCEIYNNNYDKNNLETPMQCDPVKITNNQEHINKCIICMSNEINICVVPCGHVFCCEECSQKLGNTCAICQGDIKKYVRMFVCV